MEYLFRGQTRRQGEKVYPNGEPVPSNWVYGGVFAGTGDFSIIYGAAEPEFSGADLEKHTVYTDTLGMYIGIKDEDGRRVFTGDVVEFCYYEDTKHLRSEGVVVYIEDECAFAVEAPYGTIYRMADIDILENLGPAIDNGYYNTPDE